MAHALANTLVDELGRTTTVEIAAQQFTPPMSRGSAYRAANRWLETGGKEGLPAIRLSGRRLVVPVRALALLLDGSTPDGEL